MNRQQSERTPGEPGPITSHPPRTAARQDPLQRIERSATRVARLEDLRGGFQEALIRRESRRAAAEITEHDSRVAHGQEAVGRESAELEEWIVDEAVAMIREGWTSAQLTEFGFAPEVLEQAALRAADPPG